MDPVELLLARIRAGGKWPPQSEAAAWRQIRRWRAYAESDRKELARLAGFDSSKHGRYRVDPLPERIAEAWGDHLFGEPLVITPGDDATAAPLEALEQANDLTEECRAAESELVIPDGEAWWRIYVDAELSPDAALIEWHSRLSVAPLFIGKKLVAAALISVLEGKGTGGGRGTVWRHFEVHADGVVQHVLHRGTKARLGEEVDLDAHPETEELAAGLPDDGAWRHDLPMLMGRVINRRGRDPRIGVSEFKRVEDQFLDLNDAATIGAKNARLTARKRVVVPAGSTAPRPTSGPGSLNLDELVDTGEGSFVRADGQPLARPFYDVDEDVLVEDPANEELGREGPSQFRVLEYSFDAEPLIAYKRDLVETALTRIGLMPEWVGISTGDSAAATSSGTHLRLRLMPTTKASHGKGKPWDSTLPHATLLMLRVAALAEGDGGLGVVLGDDVQAPSVARANPLPEDPVEDATVEQTLVGAGVRSRRTSIAAQHPEWDDEQIDAELEAIAGDRPTMTTFGPGPGIGA